MSNESNIALTNTINSLIMQMFPNLPFELARDIYVQSVKNCTSYLRQSLAEWGDDLDSDINRSLRDSIATSDRVIEIYEENI